MQFAQLTVLETFRDDKGFLKCRCRCSCQQITDVYWHNVKAGRTKSCGCWAASEHERYQDLRGQRFGKLQALFPTAERKNGNVVWQCRCDCGQLYYQTSRNLMRGYSKHCGCVKRSEKTAAFRDLTGQRFNRLEVLKATKERTGSGSVIWQCRCDCGRETRVSGTALAHGSQISCGCRNQEVGKELSTYLHFVEGTCIEFLKRKQRSDNSSGYPGVYRTKNGNYKAALTFQKQRYYLGTFATFEEARQERQRAEQTYHQAFLERQQKESGEKK